MKKITMIFLALTFTFLPLNSFASEKADRLLVILTSQEPVTQLMAMVLANQAFNKGAEVNLLLCGDAGDLAIKGASEVKLKPKGMSPQMLMGKLIKNGSRVEICPPYLPNAGKSSQDLINGIVVAKPPEVADRLLDENTKILSY